MSSRACEGANDMELVTTSVRYVQCTNEYSFKYNNTYRYKQRRTANEQGM